MRLACPFCAREVSGESGAELPCPGCGRPVIFPVQVSLVQRAAAPFRRSLGWQVGGAVGLAGGLALVGSGWGLVLAVGACAVLPFVLLVQGIRTDRIWMTALGLIGSSVVLLIAYNLEWLRIP